MRRHTCWLKCATSVLINATLIWLGFAPIVLAAGLQNSQTEAAIAPNNIFPSSPSSDGLDERLDENSNQIADESSSDDSGVDKNSGEDSNENSNQISDEISDDSSPEELFTEPSLRPADSILPAAPNINYSDDPINLPPDPRYQIFPVPVPAAPALNPYEYQQPGQNAFDVYRLGPGDGIFVSVQRFPELSGQVTLDLEGRVILPILGAVSLEGLTLREAQERIRLAYNRYVVNPDVTLTLVAQRPVQVTVVGEVVRPGFYPLQVPQISTALLSAGGTTGTADLRQIEVQRRLPDGSLLEETVDLFTPLQEAEALPEVRLQNNDVIIVNRLNPSEVPLYDRALVARSTIAQPQINVRILSYANRRIGNLPLPNGSRFVDALAAIGPDPDVADLGDVSLIRFDPELGRAVTIELDGKDALRGDLSQNPPLENNDVIVVGRNFINRITYALNTVTQPFRDILGFLLFFESLQEGASDLFGP
ncbi:MAG: polysaccharide biosynthesis/export family protein [Thainema sp.]